MFWSFGALTGCLAAKARAGSFQTEPSSVPGAAGRGCSDRMSFWEKQKLNPFKFPSLRNFTERGKILVWEDLGGHEPWWSFGSKNAFGVEGLLPLTFLCNRCEIPSHLSSNPTKSQRKVSDWSEAFGHRPHAASFGLRFL